MSTTIRYSYLDESRTERHSDYVGSRAAAITCAEDYLGATISYPSDGPGRATYRAAETGEEIAVSLDQLARLGAALIERPNGDVYSLWCAEVL